MKQRFATISTLAILCSELLGATYYIDYAAGDDANNGTSTSTPWQHCPGMEPFSGSYAHADGDRFIFKGGVTWPNAALPLRIQNGGASGNHDFYGADPDYYTGGSWTRPVFDGEGIPLTNNWSAVAVVAQNVIILNSSSGSADWTIISDLEIKNHVWNNNVGAAESDCFGLLFHSTDNCIATNLYIHDWVVQNATDSKYGGIGNANNGTDLTAINCIIDGPDTIDPLYTDAGTNSGSGTFQIQTVIGCDISGVTQGIFSPTLAVSNRVHHGGNSHNALTHENGIYLFGSTGTASHNRIHDWAEGTTFYMSPMWSGAGTQYAFNNIIWNTGPTPITPTEERGGGAPAEGEGRVYIYNNTLVNASLCFRVADRTNYVDYTEIDIRNNLFISDLAQPVSVEGSNVVTLIVTNNYTMTLAAAASANLTIANLFKPSVAIEGITDSGIAVAVVTNDFLNVSRPQGATNDIGAFEYQATRTIRANNFNAGTVIFGP